MHKANFPDFKEIEIEDKELFDSFFNKYPPIISELTFTNLFVWRLTRKYSFSVLNNHLIVSFIEKNQRKFLQPVGKNPAEIIKKIFENFPKAEFERVEKSIALEGKFNVSGDRDMDDYVYKISDLIELSGTKYQPKRNFVKRCKEKYNPKTCILDENTVQGFFELQEKWCNLRNCHADEKASAENFAVKETLGNFKKLGVFGICIMIKDKIEAFAIAEPLNQDTCVEHFEKANTEFVGIYQYLLHELVKHTPEKFTFINREQDLGIAGLRKAKLSYHPVKFIEKYKINYLEQAMTKP